jgi:hypothetical protein
MAEDVCIIKPEADADRHLYYSSEDRKFYTAREKSPGTKTTRINMLTSDKPILWGFRKLTPRDLHFADTE